MSLFKPAVKHEAKLRLAIAGPSGSGKTWTALAVATELAATGGGKVAVVDTEHGSASKYADIFEFDVAEMHAPFHPDKYIDAIQQAGAAGYDVIILDSLSHAWNGSGGLLEIVDAASRRYKGNSYAAWGEGTPIQNRLIEAIVQADLHLIATMRSKQDYILVERNGKQVPQKVGMAPIQRDSMEYEFDVYIDMDMENNGIVQKTRCSALTGAVLSKPGADLAETLRDWLQGEPAPEPTKPEPTKAEKETVEFDDLASASDTTATNGNGTQDARAETSPQEQAKRKRPGQGTTPDGARQAAETKAALIAASQDGGDEPASDKQLTYVRSSMSKLVENDHDKAKLLLFHIYGLESSADLTKGQASALIDWIGASKDNGYTPSEQAQTEASRLLRAFHKEQGQQELAL